MSSDGDVIFEDNEPDYPDDEPTPTDKLAAKLVSTITTFCVRFGQLSEDEIDIALNGVKGLMRKLKKFAADQPEPGTPSAQTSSAGVR